MHPLLNDGLNLVLRWAHLVAGIMWIGSSIFFHWLDSHLEKVDDPKKPGVEGVLWMVHSGGFYEVEKKLVAPGELPKHLHWFKWEAAFTWLTGAFLLVLVYHMGGGVLLLNAHAALSAPLASALCVGTIVVACFAYDKLWSSPLSGAPSENPLLTVLVSAVGLAAIALFLTHVLSGRAAYIHTGAVIGTCMVLNVWQRIIPAQMHLVASVRAGRPPDARMALAAKRRSKHNHYLTYPILFIMISNHFPSTYGASSHLFDTMVTWNWVALVVLCAIGAFVKLAMNVKDPGASVGIAAVAVAVAVAVVGTLAGGREEAASAIAMPSTSTPIAVTGRIKGTITWSGTIPPAKHVSLVGGCEVWGTGTVSIPSVVAGAGLAEAFVAVSSGVEGYAYPRARGEVVVDQQACMYAPRVVGAQTGQPVVFVNSDPLFHNVRAVATVNETFSVNMPAQNQRETKVFRRAETMVQTRCDVHPWMVAHVGVKDHPWFAVTKDDGAFVLEGVPAGDVEVEVWHEAGGRQTRTVAVPAAGEVTVDFALGGAE
jgi:uncharacterized membrane protein/plastocyanin